MAGNVSDVMTTSPRTVERSTPVAEVAQLMKTEDVGSVPITDGERLVGVVTDRDIVLRVVAESQDAQATTVGDIASSNLVTIDPQQSVEEAVRLMGEHQVRRLPVVEEDGRLAGVLAQADIATAGYDTQTGQLVEEISR